MRWHKFISAILHPIVMPTLGLFLYFLVYPYSITLPEQLYLLLIVFSATYIIPVIMLVGLRLTKKISSTELPTIQERKVPLFIMMCLFLLLARFMAKFRNAQDLSYLFYGTLIGLMVMYILFFFKLKTSIHLLSIGSALGFFIVFQMLYNQTVLPVLVVLTLLSGVLGTSRLYLKAHTPKEVYTGFLLGVLSQLFVYYIL